MYRIVVEVGLEPWEGEGFISRFYKNFVEGFYNWCLTYYHTGERPLNP
jgi:hypothetical protein